MEVTTIRINSEYLKSLMATADEETLHALRQNKNYVELKVDEERENCRLKEYPQKVKRKKLNNGCLGDDFPHTYGCRCEECDKVWAAILGLEREENVKILDRLYQPK